MTETGGVAMGGVVSAEDSANHLARSATIAAVQRSYTQKVGQACDIVILALPAGHGQPFLTELIGE